MAGRMFTPTAWVIRKSGQHTSHQDHGPHTFVFGFFIMVAMGGVIWTVKQNLWHTWGYGRASLPSTQQRWDKFSKRQDETSGTPKAT